MKGRIITRIAPSPTGRFHIGTARTALINYIYAKKYNGIFILRIEDTDVNRCEVKYEKDILDSLDWLGISPDKIYRQSNRKDIYKKFIKELIQTDKAYISEEISNKDPNKMVKIIRFKNPNTSIKFFDCVRGEISIDISELGDFVIAKDTETPLYNLAVVIDDIDMNITHVFRGDDHIANTARQVAIYNAFKKTLPNFIHLPLIHGPSGGKLSKRDGALSVLEYKELGYLKTALVNFLIFLGWRDAGTDKEMYSISELITVFDIKGLQKKAAVFDIDKLNWFNKQYIYSLNNKAKKKLFKSALLKSNFMPFNSYCFLNRIVKKSLFQFLIFDEKLIALMNEIIKDSSTKKDLEKILNTGTYDFYYFTPTIDSKIFVSQELALDTVKSNLSIISEELIKIDFLSSESLKTIVYEIANKYGRKEVLFPLRYSITGLKSGPDPFSVMHLIGKKESLKRISNIMFL